MRDITAHHRHEGISEGDEEETMDVVFRHAGSDDIPGVARVYREAVSELNRTRGFEYRSLRDLPVNPFYAYSLKYEPRGFRVAEHRGEIVGSAISWTRGTFWFLSHLFVKPSWQNHGIGRTLLEEVLSAGTGSEGMERGVVTYAYNPVSQRLYDSFGMGRREIIYRLTGTAGRLPAFLKAEHPPKGYEVKKVSARGSRELSPVDEQVLGMVRQRHHRFFLSGPGVSCYAFLRGGAIRGYVYIWPDGHVGPLAVLKPSLLMKVLRFSLARAGGAGGRLSMLVPASNREALNLLLTGGFKVQYPLCFMSSRRRWKWDRYFFHSPGMM